VLACGAWSSRLLSQLGVELPVRVGRRQVVAWQPADPEPLREGILPTFAWAGEPRLHGFPYLEALGFEVVLEPNELVDTAGIEPEQLLREGGAAAVEIVRSFLDETIPGGAGEVLATRVQLLTATPDGEPVIDRVRTEQGEGCYVALGGGDALPVAPALGRRLAELVLDGSAFSEGPAPDDLGRYRIDRAALRDHRSLVAGGR
jgi:glycine/D-amino acid oxidase-like deaminating enzyme